MVICQNSGKTAFLTEEMAGISLQLLLCSRLDKYEYQFQYLETYTSHREFHNYLSSYSQVFYQTKALIRELKTSSAKQKQDKRPSKQLL